MTEAAFPESKRRTLVSSVRPGGRRADRRQHAPRHARKRRWPRRVGSILACLSIAAGLAIGAHIFLFYARSASAGSALIRREDHMIASAGTPGHCAAPSLVPSGPGQPQARTTVGGPGASLAADADSAPADQQAAASSGKPQVFALLEAPSIGLVAPVVNGTGTAELNVAVGHVSASSWPGAPGTTVLAAHDVTWFSRIDRLTAGMTISIATSCATYRYSVTDHRIVVAGSPINESRSSTLVLVTCYPTNALFLTSQRYVLQATLTEVSHTAGSVAPTSPKPAASAPPPVVPAPAPLAAQGLGLAHNPAPLGSLVLSGTPAQTWQQSSSPLRDEAAVLKLYFAALRTAEQHQASWWAAVAPGLPFGDAARLDGATVVHNDALFDPHLVIDGGQLVGASLSTEPVLAGNTAPGIYRVDMTATVTAGQLVVSGWSVTPIG